MELSRYQKKVGKKMEKKLITKRASQLVFNNISVGSDNTHQLNQISVKFQHAEVTCNSLTGPFHLLMFKNSIVIIWWFRSIRLLFGFSSHFKELIPSRDSLSVSACQLQFDFGTRRKTPPSHHPHFSLSCFRCRKTNNAIPPQALGYSVNSPLTQRRHSSAEAETIL